MVKNSDKTLEKINSKPIIYINKVKFEDVGLIGPDQRQIKHRRKHHAEGSLTTNYENEATKSGGSVEQNVEESDHTLQLQREMEALGLPSSFGGMKQSNTKYSAHPRVISRGASWNERAKTLDMAGASLRQNTHLHPQIDHHSHQKSGHEWIQAFDYATQTYYYYCEALQMSQWEAPAEGFRRLHHHTPQALATDEAWWSAPDQHYHHYQQQRMETTGMMTSIPEPNPNQRKKLTDSASSASVTSNDDDTNFYDDYPQEMNTTSKKQKGRKNRRNRKFNKALDPDLPDHLAPSLRKYWFQRYSLFSKYDQGIMIDDQGWYSVTPEIVAWHQAKRAVRALGQRGGVVVDAFAGVGGNVIQFALAGCHVIAIEIDPYRVQLLRHNVAVYGVQDRVDIVCGDFLQLVASKRLKADVAFYSPPWGGPGYSTQNGVFDVESMSNHPEFGLTKLLGHAFEGMGCSAAIFWLPRRSFMDQIRVATNVMPVDKEQALCEIEEVELNGVIKGLSVFYGKMHA